MKTDKNGFRVSNTGQVYVAKPTLRAGPVRKEVLELLRKEWNDNPSIKKLRKHIKLFTIYKSTTSTSFIYTGGYNHSLKKVIIRDHDGANAKTYRVDLLHELVGHAFWHWAHKYRLEEWAAFNEFVRTLPPLNKYVKVNETKWRSHKQYEYSEYENEQHSAAVERFEGDEAFLSTMYHIPTTLTPEQETKLKELYERLHY